AWKSNKGKFSSLMVGVHRDGHLAYTGNVGTGYGAETVSRIMPALKAAAAPKSPFGGKNAPKGGPEIHWLKPELVAEIEFAGWTGDGNVRQASFKGLRQDKPASEVRAEIARTDPPELDHRGNGQMPTQRVTRTRGNAGATVMGIPVSNPDKALWPDDGAGQPVTKRELATYFAEISDWMLPHIKGRPCR